MARPDPSRLIPESDIPLITGGLPEREAQFILDVYGEARKISPGCFVSYDSQWITDNRLFGHRASFLDRPGGVNFFTELAADRDGGRSCQISTVMPAMLDNGPAAIAEFLILAARRSRARLVAESKSKDP